MVHDVVDASLHLIVRHGHRELRIKNRELRHQSIVENMAYLEGMLCVGYHRACIHLRASTCHRQDACYRQQTLIGCGLLLLQPELIPVVTLVIDGCCHSLRIVADTTATESQNQVDAVLTGYLDTLVQLLQRGIAHHTWILYDGLACLA